MRRRLPELAKANFCDIRYILDLLNVLRTGKILTEDAVWTRRMQSLFDVPDVLNKFESCSSRLFR